MGASLLIYGDSRSGNCYKIQQLCAELDISYQWTEVDILSGDTRTDDFLAMNPNGKIPLARLQDGNYLAESNAILAYLAEGTALAGESRLQRARVLQWLFFEQYSHEPYIATSRFIVKYLGSPEARRAELDAKRAGGYQALTILNAELSGQDYLLGSQFSLADIALFAYTHVAHEGGFSLTDYPAVRAWIERISARERFVPMASVPA